MTILQQMAVEYIILTNSAYYNNFLTNESKVFCSNRIDIFFPQRNTPRN